MLLNNLYRKFINDFQPDPDYVIEFFRNNSVIINNLKEFTSKEDLESFMEIYYQYLNALVEKGRYNDTVDSFQRIIPSIESSIDEFKLERARFNYYRWAVYKKAEACYQLRDYSSALVAFKQLYIYEPQSDSLKLWIEYSKAGKRMLYINILWVIGATGLGIDIIGKGKISDNLRLLIFALGISSIITAFILDTIIKRNRRIVKVKK